MATSPPNPKTCVVTVTFYPDTTDIRYNLALQLCRLAHKTQTHLVIVDGSPSPSVRVEFTNAGNGYVHVFAQDASRYLGKGGAMRQAIQHATITLMNLNQDYEDDDSRGENQKLILNQCAICFTEPEKVDLLNHISKICQPILDKQTEVVVPFRETTLFRQTYPIEQYHSESFASLHFNSLAKKYAGFRNNIGCGGEIDWHFGPFAFRGDLAYKWLEYEGNSWDAQFNPFVKGVKNDGWRILSVEVEFKLSREMKEQEEGRKEWTGKRLYQLNVLFDLLGKELGDDESGSYAPKNIVRNEVTEG